MQRWQNLCSHIALWRTVLPCRYTVTLRSGLNDTNAMTYNEQGTRRVKSVNLHSNFFFFFCTDKVTFVKFPLSLAVPGDIYRSLRGAVWTFLQPYSHSEHAVGVEYVDASAKGYITYTFVAFNRSSPLVYLTDTFLETQTSTKEEVQFGTRRHISSGLGSTSGCCTVGIVFFFLFFCTNL